MTEDELSVGDTSRASSATRIRKLFEAYSEIAAAEFAKAFSRSLDLRLEQSATKKEKEDFAAELDGQLRRMGLAIRCPLTDRPAHLRVQDGPSGSEPASVFAIEAYDGRGGRRMTAHGSGTLAKIEFTLDDPLVFGPFREKGSGSRWQR